MTTSVEVWKPIVGYEGFYEVSDQGRIRSLPGQRQYGNRLHKFNGRILKPQCAGRYLHVTLSKGSRIKTLKIHSLVAQAFLPRCPGIQGRRRGCYHIDHINNIPHDNRACNLQWLTHYQNTYEKAGRKRDAVGKFV
jgi:hypothetical protein